jgi:hypothetical protein
MPKTLDIQAAADYLNVLAATSTARAIEELIWNSLDADAHTIRLELDSDELSFSEIRFIDDGHGINYADSENIFQLIGGSSKKHLEFSPEHRILHGKEGIGRFKSFSLGSLITFRSRYLDNGELMTFDVKWDRSNINHPVINEPKPTSKGSTGLEIIIQNLDQGEVAGLHNSKVLEEIEQHFAAFYKSYRDFRVQIDGYNLEFERFIIKDKDYPLTYQAEEETLDFTVKVLEWSIKAPKKLYLCNTAGVTYAEIQLQVGTDLSVSAYLMSEYISRLHSANQLSMYGLNPILIDVIKAARQKVRSFIRERLHESALTFIDTLKKENIYPYHTPPEDSAEEAEREVFDVVAFHINEFIPEFDEQEKSNKKFTLALVRQAIESKGSQLRHILSEVVNLPEEKLKDLGEILEETSLTDMIDTVKEIKDRLRIIYELREIIFGENSGKILERKHFHKILAGETWIFGDDYTYGADDVNLKNVLKAYLKHLGRDDFEEVIQNESTKSLEDDIPDICLWKSYKRGAAGQFENLVIEIKRPSKKITPLEVTQIQRYASEVSKDARFTKENTSWRFILLGREFDETVEFQANNQGDRKYGHIAESKASSHVDVFVLNWGHILADAEARLQYLKEKLNYKISEEREGIIHLKNKYPLFLPELNTSENHDSSKIVARKVQKRKKRS